MGNESESDDSSDSDNHDGLGDQDAHTRAPLTKEKIAGHDHPDTAASFPGSGVLIQEETEQVQALENLRIELIIKEKVFGTGHVSTATTYLDIASLLQGQSRYGEAVGYYLKALGAKEQILAAGHLDAAKLYCKVGLLLREQGNPEQGWNTSARPWPVPPLPGAVRTP